MSWSTDHCSNPLVGANAGRPARCAKGLSGKRKLNTLPTPTSLRR
jgi:hypothetical protein